MVSIPMANERLRKELLSLFMPTGLKSFMMGNIKEDYCKHVLIIQFLRVVKIVSCECNAYTRLMYSLYGSVLTMTCTFLRFQSYDYKSI